MNSSRGVCVAGNWKMNQNQKEVASFFDSINSKLPPIDSKKIQSIIFPPFLSIPKAIENSNSIRIGAQNAHWKTSGAFTGEISGPMLEEIGIKHVLLGHSERRQYFGETNETVFLRAKSLLEQGFQTMICVGETQAQREANQTKEVLKNQIGALFEEGSLKNYQNGEFQIAYEPVWAIGTGLTATPEQAEQAHRDIRELLAEAIGSEASSKVQILYGGSVKPGNFKELLSCENIDGGLVGGASLKPDDYLSLIQIAAEVCS